MKLPSKGPYTKIVGELPQMRQETAHLARQAVNEGRRAYVLVNNRAEGNAPLTVLALTGLVRASGHSCVGLRATWAREWEGWSRANGPSDS
jgi:hypothetical protein